MEKPLVSVIITTYRREFGMVQKSIESVLKQTYPCMELIVVDDNGKEADRFGIEKGLKQYQEQKMPVYYMGNEANSGAQISRNRGILRSNGMYIAFLDDDDRWMQEKIEKQVKAMEESEAGLVYCKGYQVTEDDAGTSTSRKPYNMSSCFLAEVSFKDLLYGDYIGTTSQAMIRRDVFAVCGLFDPGQPARQDYEMWIRVSRFYRCVGVSEFLFDHVQHTQEQITKSGDKALEGLWRVYVKYRLFAGYTSRCHFRLLLAKQCFRNKKPGNGFCCGVAACWYLLLASLFERKELNRRKRIHRQRQKETAV